ncbi:MAG TPA: RiPP maturation radical SAM C-methyltransferase [Vicinamibacteria bacterium]
MKVDEGILLVCMPFGPAFSPSIGLSLLKAGLATHGMSARVRYFSIRFAELVGHRFYHRLAAEGEPTIEDLAGEWVFSNALFDAPAAGEYVDDILRRRVTWTTNEGDPPASPALIDQLLRARERVAPFLSWCLDEVLRARPKLVGFTSVFQQHVASLALARQIKRAIPEAFIVFGGANCEGVMGAETVRQFPFVDAVVSGEADLVFPELAQRVLAGEPVDDLPGVRGRRGVEADFAGGRFINAPMTRDLDSLPYPDYTDYFQQFAASRFAPAWRPSVFFETSRGCWWGEKMHCTFCGLNGQTMTFRSKSPRRALEELKWLTKRYPRCRIQVTDNILDMRYFKDFIPALAARPLRARLFYEVKANLKKEQLRMLRKAGIRHVQPGIESFSDPTLKLMRKGVSGLQNVQLLKWCKELGIRPLWNLIWGFPGEQPAEHERMAGLVRRLTHLRPPESYGMIRLDRFSPNFNDADRLGFMDVAPLPPYRYVYRLPSEALANLAYFFTFRYREPRDVASYVAPLVKELRSWHRHWPMHDLFSVQKGDWLLLCDLRGGSRTPLTLLRGADRILYQACDSASDIRRLGECLAQSREAPLSNNAIAERLASLLKRGLLVTDGFRYLALAIPLGNYSPPPPALARFYGMARSLGRAVSGGWVIPSVAAGKAGSPRKRRSQPRSPPQRSRAESRRERLSVSQFSINDRGDVLIRRRSPLQTRS